MNISELLKQRDAVMKEFSKGLRMSKPDAAMIARPLAVREARAAALEARINMIEARRIDQNARVDAEVTALVAEIATLKTDIARGQDMLAPLANKSSGKKAAAAKGDAKAATGNRRKASRSAAS